MKIKLCVGLLFLLVLCVGLVFLLVMNRGEEAPVNAYTVETIVQMPNDRSGNRENLPVPDLMMPTPLAPPNLLSVDWRTARYITEAWDKGIFLHGWYINSRFNYHAVITRTEFCILAYKWVEYATGMHRQLILDRFGLTNNLDSFADVNAFFYWEIRVAFALGITYGIGNNLFYPDGLVTREQAAAFIIRTCRAIGIDVSNPPASDFADMDTVAYWAVDAVNFVYAHGIMSATEDNTFDPKGYITIAESIVAFNHLFDRIADIIPLEFQRN